MRQFDVFSNPIAGASRPFPFVVLLQSDLVETGDDRVVAPLALRWTDASLDWKLMPFVTVDGRECHILVPGLSTVQARRLKSAIANLAPERDRIVAALDYLFLGF